MVIPQDETRDFTAASLASPAINENRAAQPPEPDSSESAGKPPVRTMVYIVPWAVFSDHKLTNLYCNPDFVSFGEPRKDCPTGIIEQCLGKLRLPTQGGIASILLSRIIEREPKLRYFVAVSRPAEVDPELDQQIAVVLHRLHVVGGAFSGVLPAVAEIERAFAHYLEKELVEKAF